MPGKGRVLAAWLTGLPACAVLILNTVYWRGDHDLSNQRSTRRYWEDLTIAAADYIHRGSPDTESAQIGSREGQSLRGDLQRFVTKTVSAEGIRSWQFWRTVSLKPYLQRERIFGRPSDDVGRAGLAKLGFRVLGGVSPFLPLWVGTLACLPVLLWVGFELSQAGRPVAGVVFPLLLTSSPYAVELLTLPYSAVGFYWIALIALVPMSVYAVAGRSHSPAPFLVRCLATGLAFAICALCRGGTVLLLPGYGLALLLAVRRVFAPHSFRRTGTAAGAAFVLFLLPYLLARPPGHHEIWLGVWEGLGDFDRVRGHAWNDRIAKDVLSREAIQVPLDAPVWINAMENDHIFRRLVLESIRADPAWYVTILGKRMLATVGQWKLRPYGPRDGISMAPARSANEGAIDDYYRMTTTAEWLGVAGRKIELPLSVLLFPTALLALSWIASFRTAAGRGLRARLGDDLALLVCPALAALSLPVLITTAGGLETEAFVLVYHLGAALLLEESTRLILALRARDRRANLSLT